MTEIQGGINLDTNDTIYVGIDLSTTTIGVAIIFPNTTFMTWDVKMQYWDSNFETTKQNHTLLLNIVSEIKNELKKYIRGSLSYKIEISIELSNFQNPRITQRFSKYFGILETYFLIMLGDRISVIKAFNANEWFKHLRTTMNVKENLNELTRDIRKQMSLEFLKINLPPFAQKGKYSEDEADAYCIAYFSKICRNTEAIVEEVNAAEMLQRKIIKLKKRIEREKQKQQIRTKPNDTKIRILTEELNSYKRLRDKNNGK